MNDSQNQIIIEGLILQIETLRIALSFAKAKAVSKSSSGCCCESYEEHSNGGCIE